MDKGMPAVYLAMDHIHVCGSVTGCRYTLPVEPVSRLLSKTRFRRRRYPTHE